MAKTMLFVGLIANAFAHACPFIILPPLGRSLGLADLQTGSILSLAALLQMLAAPGWARATCAKVESGFARKVATKQRDRAADRSHMNVRRSISARFGGGVSCCDWGCRRRHDAGGMGMMGAAFGFGTILGGALAWRLGGTDAIAAFMVVSAVGFVVLVLLWWKVPETLGAHCGVENGDAVAAGAVMAVSGNDAAGANDLQPAAAGHGPAHAGRLRFVAARFDCACRHDNDVDHGGDDRSAGGGKPVPLYDGYLAVRYQLPCGLFARAELSLAGKESLESTGSAIQPATQEVGLQLGYETAHWSARLFVENLTNVRRATGMAFQNFAFDNDGNRYAPIGRSRQFGVELSAHL